MSLFGILDFTSYFIFLQVASKDVIEVAKIIRTEMENAIKLTVPIPVKIKIGPSWGDLSTLKHVL